MYVHLKIRLVMTLTQGLGLSSEGIRLLLSIVGVCPGIGATWYVGSTSQEGVCNQAGVEKETDRGTRLLELAEGAGLMLLNIWQDNLGSPWTFRCLLGNTVRTDCLSNYFGRTQGNYRGWWASHTVACLV